MSFLDDRSVGPAIVDLLRGSDVRCAVAFWGAGARSALLEDSVPTDARIVCDISMGGSNPTELRALGAPGSRSVRHLPGLHAKVYLSDRGLIVASANASDNGIGFLGAAGLVEAATYFPQGSETYAAASAWFEVIWRRSSPLDSEAVEAAEAAWRSRPRTRAADRKTTADPRSLLDTVSADPGSFRGVGFVFTSGTSTKAQVDEAVRGLVSGDDQRAVPQLSKRDRQLLRRWKPGDLFSEWEPQDVDAWPRKFVCAHRGARGAVSYWFYERAHEVVLDGTRGMVLATRPRGLGRALGFAHGRAELIATDAPRIVAILDHLGDQGHRLYESGEKLVALLAEVEGE